MRVRQLLIDSSLLLDLRDLVDNKVQSVTQLIEADSRVADAALEFCARAAVLRGFSEKDGSFLREPLRQAAHRKEVLVLLGTEARFDHVRAINRRLLEQVLE